MIGCATAGEATATISSSQKRVDTKSGRSTFPSGIHRSASSLPIDVSVSRVITRRCTWGCSRLYSTSRGINQYVASDVETDSVTVGSPWFGRANSTALSISTKSCEIRSNRFAPAAVGTMPDGVLIKRRIPSAFSRRATEWVTADCPTPSA